MLNKVLKGTVDHACIKQYLQLPHFSLFTKNGSIDYFKHIISL